MRAGEPVARNPKHRAGQGRVTIASLADELAAANDRIRALDARIRVNVPLPAEDDGEPWDGDEDAEESPLFAGRGSLLLASPPCGRWQGAFRSSERLEESSASLAIRQSLEVSLARLRPSNRRSTIG